MKISRSAILKLAIILAVAALMPFAIPATIEFVLLADLLGLEALALVLIYQGRDILRILRNRCDELFQHLGATILLLASCYMLQPRVFATHAAGSGILLVLACSVLMALAIWLPAFYLSVSGFT